MAPRTPEVAHKRARVGGLARAGADPERLAEAQRDLKATLAAEYIADVLASTPPLTDADRLTLVRLLTNPST